MSDAHSLVREPRQLVKVFSARKPIPSPRDQWAATPRLREIRARLDALDAAMLDTADFAEMGRIDADRAELEKECLHA